MFAVEAVLTLQRNKTRVTRCVFRVGRHNFPPILQGAPLNLTDPQILLFSQM